MLFVDLDGLEQPAGALVDEPLAIHELEVLPGLRVVVQLPVRREEFDAEIEYGSLYTGSPGTVALGVDRFSASERGQLIVRAELRPRWALRGDPK